MIAEAPESDASTAETSTNLAVSFDIASLVCAKEANQASQQIRTSCGTFGDCRDKMSAVDSFVEQCPVVYVLRLWKSDGYVFYVGSTVNLRERVQAHQAGQVACTKKLFGDLCQHLEIDEVKKCSSVSEARLLEDVKVETLIRELKAASRVFGGSFCQFPRPAQEEEMLTRKLWASQDACFQCGKQGHYASECQMLDESRESPDAEMHHVCKERCLTSALMKKAKISKSVKKKHCNLEDKIRSIRTQNNMFSLVDVAMLVCGKDANQASQQIRTICEKYEFIQNKVVKIKFLGQAQKMTPCGDVYVVTEVILLLPGRRAALVRTEAVRLFVQHHGGDRSAVEQILRKYGTQGFAQSASQIESAL